MLFLLLILNCIAGFAPHASVKGALIALIFYIIINTNSRYSISFCKLSVFLYSFLSLAFIFYSLPTSLSVLRAVGLSAAISNWELVIYSFKQLTFAGYDANYFGLIIVVLSMYYAKILLFLLSFLTGSRTPIISAIVAYIGSKIVNLKSIWVYLLFFIFIFSIYISFDYTFFKSAAMKQETVLNLIENFKSGNLSIILFGNGINFAPGLNTTGHTLYGVAAKNGIPYALLSFLIVFKLRTKFSNKINNIIFMIYLCSLISLTAFNFIFPLVYALRRLALYNEKNYS